MTTDHRTTPNSRGTEEMRRAIERLRASREKSDQEARTAEPTRSDEEFLEAGSRAGREWAMKTATFHELEDLPSLRDELGDDWVVWFSVEESAEFMPDERLFFALSLDVDADGDRMASRMFWRDHPDSANPHFVRGFAEGALEFWEEVKAKL